MKKCASCGMPIDSDTKSKHNENYCTYCQNQTTGNMASFEEVREGSIKAAMDHMEKTRIEAEKMVDTMLPMLPRWEEKAKMEH